MVKGRVADILKKIEYMANNTGTKRIGLNSIDFHAVREHLSYSSESREVNYMGCTIYRVVI